MARAAYGYQAVAPRDYVPGGVPPSRLPLDSPTLLTRRRYGERCFQGYVLDWTAIGSLPTTLLRPHREPNLINPALRNLVGSDPGVFAGGLAAQQTGASGEAQPDLFPRWITSGRNLLVAIAHRSPGNPVPLPATPRGLNVVQPDFRQRQRRYALPFQLESPTSQQLWPSIGQWMVQKSGG